MWLVLAMIVYKIIVSLLFSSEYGLLVYFKQSSAEIFLFFQKLFPHLIDSSLSFEYVEENAISAQVYSPEPLPAQQLITNTVGLWSQWPPATLFKMNVVITDLFEWLGALFIPDINWHCCVIVNGAMMTLISREFSHQGAHHSSYHCNCC